ncbi:U-box domain-containing protein 19-like [Vitis riparia]|uniref:U-box domain-containing protein 19-like n=1 Tax=Vitis riparia TaxID=96939 RepID=UPI00155B1F15|nr:U-box domain-containing protein 19-like [Vitis riparia]
MFQSFNRSNRRILSFPAVHPCESISPVTLLGSLVALSTSILNYQSKFFPTQKRNARETLRQVGILSIFFEEIQDRRSVLPDSVVLCFSELHLAFQKIQFLLEDCSREGARLWILMKSQFVATQFRVLIRAFATALEVLPLNCIDVTSEVKELVELVAKQARKARFDLDANDECAAKDVIWILNQFEKIIEPDMSVVKRVLDHLEIRSWSECNKEIRFMEELSLECDEREVTLLKSLMGLMSYCRGVMFEEIESSGTDQTEGRCSVEMLSCLNPEDFRCPISLELMTDPVTVSTGQTYDRSSIQKWLRAGNIICPKTGEKLINKELVPNSALRKLIQQFCEDHGVSLAKTETQNSNTERTISVNSPAAAEATRFLSKFLARRLVSGTGEQKNKAAYEIRLLAKSSVFNRCCLIEAGTVPPLLNLLSSTDPPTQENAIAALLKLSKHVKGKKVIMDSGGLKLILKVLKAGPRLESRQIAAATLFYLASVDKYRALIGETPEAIPSLVELIKTGTTIGKMHAVVAIFGLLLCRENCPRVLAAGTVPLLVHLLASSVKEDLATDSLAALAKLSEHIDGSLAILKASGLPLITRILQSSPSRTGKEYCVSILLSLCTNGSIEVTVDLAKDPTLMTSLYSLVTEGTSHGSKKACSLLKIIHKFRETDSSGLRSSRVPQERFLRVR